MKPAVVLLSLGLLLTAGALGIVLVSGNRDSGAHATESQTSPPPAAGAPAAASDARSAEVLQRLDSLAREVDDLRAQLATLRASSSREPAAVVASAEPVEDESVASFASEHRGAILKVIEEDREAQRRKAEEEQRARDLQASLARAERTAKQFGLAADQQKALADVYILERQKIDEMRNQMRDQGGAGGDPEAMRNTFRELRDWRLNELTVRLGSDLADKINESDIAAFRGFGGRDRRGNRPNGTDPGPGGPEGGNRPGGGF
jgi:hypothetical protein